MYYLGQTCSVHFSTLCHHRLQATSLFPSGFWLVGTLPPFQLRRRLAKRVVVLLSVWVWSRVAVFLYCFHVVPSDSPFVPWRRKMQAEVWRALGEVLWNSTLQDHSVRVLKKVENASSCTYIFAFFAEKQICHQTTWYKFATYEQQGSIGSSSLVVGRCGHNFMNTSVTYLSWCWEFKIDIYHKFIIFGEIISHREKIIFLYPYYTCC